MKNKLIYFLIAIAIFAHYNIQAQIYQIDSLKNVLKTSKDDTNKVILFHQLYLLNDSLAYAEKEYFLANKLNYKKGIAISFIDIGRFYYFSEKYTLAFENLTKGVIIAEEIGDKTILARGFRYIGYVYMTVDPYTAKEYYEKSLNMSIDINDEISASYALSAIGNIYETVSKDFKLALEFYLKSLKIREKKGSLEEIASSLNETSRVYQMLEDYDMSSKLRYRGLEIAEKANSYRNIIYFGTMIGNDYYHRLHDPQNALKYQLKAFNVSKTKDNNFEIENIAKVIAFSYASIGDYKKSSEFFKFYCNYSDSVNLAISRQKYNLSALQHNYKTELEKQKLLVKDAEIANQKIVAEKQTFFRNAFIIGFFLILIFFIWIYNDYQKKEKLYRRLDFQNKKLKYAQEIIEKKNKEYEIINEELQENIIIAKSATKIKQQFLANMSHEMRTPMNGIIGMVEIISKTKLNKIQSEYLNIIKESSKTLLSLINDVLDLTKIESGNVVLYKETIITTNLIKKIETLFNSFTNTKNIVFSINCSKNFPTAFTTDEKRLMQIISNLITNAIKFTEKGSITIDLILKEILNEEYHIEIDVTDTGIGISKADQKLIFEKFSQVDDSKTRTTEGTGLGLSISKELAKLLGGEIGVESQIGKGSKFWFTLKASQPIELPLLNEDIKIISKINDLNLSVLLVEDILINRKVGEIMLKNIGCTVDLAENGAIALEKIKQNKYDVVFMDIQMPVMDGITAVKELKKMDIMQPFIIGLSAEAMAGDAEKYLAIGMDDYITKPIIIDVLINKLSDFKNRKKTILKE